MVVTACNLSISRKQVDAIIMNFLSKIDVKIKRSRKGLVFYPMGYLQGFIFNNKIFIENTDLKTI
jgi:hypothetical protein